MSEIFWQGDDASLPQDFDVAANWSIGYVPGAGDDIIFSPQYNNSCTENLDQGTTAFGDIIVEEGFTAPIGSFELPLTCAPSKFEYRGGGTIHIDIGAAAIPVVITNSGNYGGGKSGVNLVGTGITVLTISGGSCAVATNTGPSGGELATVATARVSTGGRLLIGKGTTLTNLDINGGTVDLRAGCATVKIYQGRLTTQGVAAISSKLTAYNGVVLLNGSGTIADLLLDGTALVDFTGNGVGRTVSTFQNLGGTVNHDPAVVTFSATTNPDRIVTTTVQQL